MKPTITITFDPETQVPEVAWENFQTFEFILAVLGAGKEVVRNRKQAAAIAALQQQQAEQAQTQALASKLNGRRLHLG